MVLTRPFFSLAALAAWVTLGAPDIAVAQQNPDTLIGLSLEQLMQVEVESVSRREERLFDAPAAAYVLTEQDLRRSAARTLPEALRMVPGLHVAQVNANAWSVGSRGGAGQYHNKLLVLVDGRTIYSRLFGGVFWEEEDIPLSEIQRIEVIKGPGATLWGSNAVDGIINIVTKRASGNDGTHLTAQAGDRRSEYGLSHSATLGSQAALRAHGSYKRMEELETPEGSPGSDESWIARGGARFDWEGEASTFTLSGDVYDGEFRSLLSVAVPQPPFQSVDESTIAGNGGHVLARFRRSFAGGSSLTLSGYYDYGSRVAEIFDEKERTLDLEAQHELRLGERNQVVWGMGYRRVVEEGQQGVLFVLDPARYTENVLNAFVQDEITLLPGRLSLTLGTKLERTGYTGWELQPKGSIELHASDDQMLWASVSRAVRVPTRIDRDAAFNTGIFPAPQPGLLTYVNLVGSDFDAERLTAFEIGYRLRPDPRVSFDLAGFLNRYDDLRVYVLGAPEFVPTPPPGRVEIDSRATNGAEGHTVGAELIARVEPLKGWVVEGSYSHATEDQTVKPGVGELALEHGIQRTPKHQARMRSSSTLPGDLELDVMARYESEVPGLGIDAGTNLDLKLGWQPRAGLYLALGMTNLSSGNRIRVVPESTVLPSVITESFFASVSFRF